MRYADDFVIMAQYIGDRILGFVESKLEDWMGLTINRDKTRVVRLNEPGVSLDFLGYTFRYDRDRHGGSYRYLNMFPSKKSLARARQRVREMTGPKMCFMPIRMLIENINQYLRGWSGYFSQGYPRVAYRHINSYTRERLTRHLKRRSQRPYRPPRGVTYYAQLDRLGLVYL